jgi:hypothetical protein
MKLAAASGSTSAGWILPVAPCRRKLAKDGQKESIRKILKYVWKLTDKPFPGANRSRWSIGYAAMMENIAGYKTAVHRLSAMMERLRATSAPVSTSMTPRSAGNKSAACWKTRLTSSFVTTANVGAFMSIQPTSALVPFQEPSCSESHPLNTGLFQTTKKMRSYSRAISRTS